MLTYIHLIFSDSVDMKVEHDFAHPTNQQVEEFNNGIEHGFAHLTTQMFHNNGYVCIRIHFVFFSNLLLVLGLLIQTEIFHRSDRHL